MKIFFDTEFTGLHQGTSLISLAMISENGHIFYAEFEDYDTNQISPWLKENVINHLFLKQDFSVGNHGVLLVRGNKYEIRQHISYWLSKLGKVEFIGDVYMYDWMLFCELFDGALNIPPNISYIPIDFATLLWQKGIDPKIDREKLIENDQLTSSLLDFPFPLNKHNALYDAVLLKLCFENLFKS